MPRYYLTRLTSAAKDGETMTRHCCSASDSCSDAVAVGWAKQILLNDPSAKNPVLSKVVDEAKSVEIKLD
jgi:hypothetical protein